MPKNIPTAAATSPESGSATQKESPSFIVRIAEA